jgi:hypothetical protein
VLFVIVSIPHTSACLLYNNVAQIEGYRRTTIAALTDNVQTVIVLRAKNLQQNEAILYDLANPLSPII